MVDPSSLYLTTDAYHASRTRQDRHLSTEFRTLHTSIDQIKHELKEFKDDVKEFKDDVKEFKDDVKEFKDDVKEFKDDVNERFDRLEAETRRSYAYFRNSTLENPILRIQPLVVYRPGQGILEPNPSYFPRHARDLYALKEPETLQQIKTLLHLIKFYDIEQPDSAHSSDDDDDDHSSSDDEHIIPRPDLVVEALENILGLNEQRFIAFGARASEHANRPPSHPIKRSQLAEINLESEPRKRTIPFRELIKASPGFSDSLDQSPRTGTSSDHLTTGNVMWKEKDKFARSSHIAIATRLEDAQQPQHQHDRLGPGSDEGKGVADDGASSSTRPFTNPRAVTPLPLDTEGGSSP